jgi:hemerythrin-like domain-containing protein
MLRHKSLIPLSHQHQHALALCVRVARAQPIAEADLPAWQEEIERLFEQEITVHFAAEEQIVFPAAEKFRQLRPLVEELLLDHAALRELFSHAQAQTVTANTLGSLAQKLSEHIRKEERQLFEQLQKLLSPEDLTTMGKRLNTALEEATHACGVPHEATKLKAKNLAKNRQNPETKNP